MNAIDMLEEQHREVEAIFAQIAESEVGSKKRLVKILVEKLIAHMEIEEEIFYPAAYEVESNEVRRAVDEHNEVRPLMEEIMSLNSDDDDFDELLKELEIKVAQHVKDEEGDLFPECREAMTREELVRLGKKMSELLDKLESLTNQRPVQPKWDQDLPTQW